MTDALTLTPSAAKRIALIAQKQARPAILRLAVEGGGCSGFQYKFDLADAADFGRRAAEVFNPKAAETRNQHGDQNPDHKASSALLFARGVVVIGGLRRF